MTGARLPGEPDDDSAPAPLLRAGLELGARQAGRIRGDSPQDVCFPIRVAAWPDIFKTNAAMFGVGTLES